MYVLDETLHHQSIQQPIILLLYYSTAKAYNTYIILCIAEAIHSVIDTYEGVVI